MKSLGEWVKDNSFEISLNLETVTQFVASEARKSDLNPFDEAQEESFRDLVDYYLRTQILVLKIADELGMSLPRPS